MEYIDLRSDTVTQPTVEMRKAINSAVVGDDVYGEDPTVNALEMRSAEMMGKEAALFIPSGTMGNLTAVLTHCSRGDEVIMGNRGHTFLYEGGGISALGGVHPHTLPNDDNGELDIGLIEGAIRSDDPHFPRTRLIILENTQNRCGGIALPSDYIRDVGQVAEQHNLKLHIDGARIFNAAVLLKTSAEKLVGPADSVTFCLSKGLCAPVGSVLCGSKNFIIQARRIRKQLGGGMRQAGILAAAGIIALNSMVERLEEDHHRAATMAKELSSINWFSVDYTSMSTNMVFINLVDDLKISQQDIRQKLKEHNILVGLAGERGFRLVTHYWIDDDCIQKTINTFRNLL